MNLDARVNLIVGCALAVLAPLVVGFLTALSFSHAGEVASALGSVIGGVIGAGGAAGAVYIMLARQREEDTDKVSGAILAEIIEACRYLPDLIMLCELIRTGQTQMPKADLPRVMTLPVPTIYPAVADRVNLLPSPTLVVAFYSSLAEISLIIAMLTHAQTPTPLLPPEYVNKLADALINLCQIGSHVVQRTTRDEAHEAALFTGKRTIMLQRITEQLESARKVFPDAQSFTLTGPEP